MKPIQSVDLQPEQKVEVEAGQEFKLHSFAVDRRHMRAALLNQSFFGKNTWYLFDEHIEILGDDDQQVFPPQLKSMVRLDVPYKSQLDNEENPTGSCNVTSIAMCLDYLGARRRTNDGQFEDELYRYCENNGLSRHSPQDLAYLVQIYGCRDTFRADATIEQVKEWLSDGNPVVIHGYFTDFGHIVCLAGYDAKSFLVHDPYGEWTAYGYKKGGDRGKYQNYSYDMIRQLCIPDGNFWAHFISK